MNKVILENSDYSFDATNGTVTVLNRSELLTKEGLMIITNVSSNDIIYNFACKGFGGVINGNVLSLEYSTAGMSDSDELQIILYSEVDINQSNILDVLKTSSEQLSCLNSVLEELREIKFYLKSISE